MIGENSVDHREVTIFCQKYTGFIAKPKQTKQKMFDPFSAIFLSNHFSNFVPDFTGPTQFFLFSPF
jgi:hypothetical protein